MNASVDELISKLRNADDAVRGPAWQAAGPLGAPAVKPLVAVMSHADFEIARSARRALWLIVRHAGRPGASKEAGAVTKELLSLLPTAPAPVQREAVWMLSEIGGDDVIAPISSLLANAELRGHALCALLRLPSSKATNALKSAMSRAPEEFKYALADALRKRGETVKGYPSKKLVPSRPTTVAQPAAQ